MVKLVGLRWRECSRLRNVLELVDDRLNDRPFTHQQFVRKVYEMIFHILAQSCDETPVPVQRAVA